MKHFVFVSSNYPGVSRPQCGTFVRELVHAVARAGVKCTVICPVSIFGLRHGQLDPVDAREAEAGVRVLRPRYISFSNRKILSYNTARITQLSFLQAVFKAASFLDAPATAVYGHFLYPGGSAAVRLARELKAPSIVAVGESSFWSMEPIGIEKASREFMKADLVVAVSNLIRRELIGTLRIPEERISVLPNGVDHSRFYPRAKGEMRRRHNLPEDLFIIAFTGHFDERKGPDRLLRAASDLKGTGVMLLGAGDIPLFSRNLLFKGVVEHGVVPEMLSAADIFVLPTLAEGSCNSILEAMACGLPVITSKGEFNDDILSDEAALRVDPLDTDVIREAILRLKTDNRLREKMSEAAVEWSARFDVNRRAKEILALADDVTRCRAAVPCGK